MLQQMRSGAASWIAKGLMFVLVASFGIWGIADYIRNFGGNAPVAKVGNTEISQPEFAEAWRRQLSQLQRRFGGNFSAEQAHQLGLDASVLNQLVEDRLYQQAARDMGITITEADVRNALLNAPAFKGEDGRFNRLAYERYLREQGYSEATLVALLQQDVARTRLLGSLFGSLTSAPKLMADTILGYRLERRFADYVVVDSAKLPAPPAPTAEKIEEYYKANPAAFTAPERRSLSWFEITPAALAAKMEVSDAELHEEYEANQSAYVTPEKRAVEQVVFTTEAEAKAAKEALDKGEDFMAMAARTKKLKPDDVKLGSVAKSELPAAIATAIFDLPLNTVSDPIRSPFGWHLARVTKVEPGSTKTFDQAKDELHQQVALRKAIDGMTKLRAQIDDQIAGGAMLNEIAKTQNATPQSVANIDAQGNGPDGKPVETLPKLPAFLTQAFDTSIEAEPQIIDLPEGGLAVLKVTEIQPSAVRPLDEVKDQVVAALQQKARAEAAADQAKQIAERVRNGSDLAKEAATFGGTVHVSAALMRSGQPAERAFSPSVVSALFDAKKAGEVVTGPAAAVPGVAPNSAIVARLSRIKAADPAAIAAQEDKSRQQLAGGMAQDLVQRYREKLQEEIGVKVNAEARARAAGF
ncbi:MAG TPA: SurA N-terminal domain-containing protein [Ferrovibrio sp.]|uniref:peptidylprolyl isomerase n=1 Tax=Ferrovibrio sp. TaxID=1917215 RepID=UPI002ED4F4EA